MTGHVAVVGPPFAMDHSLAARVEYKECAVSRQAVYQAVFSDFDGHYIAISGHGNGVEDEHLGGPVDDEQLGFSGSAVSATWRLDGGAADQVAVWKCL